MITARTVGPATEPVSLVEAKAHLGVTITDDDARITSLIKGAREWAENDSGRSFITQTWEAKIDAFPLGNIIKLPKTPIQSITSVAYIDTNGDSQTFTDFTLDILGERIYLDYGESWPSTQDIENAVTITYVAGYGAAASVPEPIKQAIKLQIEKMFDRPDAGYLSALGSVCSALLNQYRDMRRL